MSSRRRAVRSPRDPNRLLRFSRGMRRDPAVDAWLDARGSGLGAIARRWSGAPD